jgi:hypothetical protein
MKKLRVVALCVVTAFLASCGCDDCTNCCVDTTPPAVPTCVTSITGDGYVIVQWAPVRVSDLAGYGVYRSMEEFGAYDPIGEVGCDELTEFVDEPLTNGVTYYYAVTAYDRSGNESDLSYETVQDTPRPENLDDPQPWSSMQYQPYESAIAFLPEVSQSIQILHHEDPDAQFYLTKVGSLFRIVPIGANLIQDYGYTSHPDEVSWAPSMGWSMDPNGVEVILNHVYVIRTWRHYYAKVRIESINPNGVTIYWAFQIQQYSPELAPRRPSK